MESPWNFVVSHSTQGLGAILGAEHPVACVLRMPVYPDRFPQQ